MFLNTLSRCLPHTINHVCTTTAHSLSFCLSFPLYASLSSSLSLHYSTYLLFPFKTYILMTDKIRPLLEERGNASTQNRFFFGERTFPFIHPFIHLPSTHVLLFWETDQDYVLSIYGLSMYLTCCWGITASHTNTYHPQMQARNKNTQESEVKDPTCIPTRTSSKGSLLLLYFSCSKYIQCIQCMYGIDSHRC